MELANSTECRKEQENVEKIEQIFGGGYSSLIDLAGRMPSFAARIMATTVAAVREGGTAHV